MRDGRASIETIAEAVSAAGPGLTATEAARLLGLSNIQEEALNPWRRHGHSAAQSYGRDIAWAAEFFELLVVSWDPGDASAIHDHGRAEWGAVLLLGEMEHSVLAFNEGVLVTKNTFPCASGSVIPISGSLVHRMSNSSNVPVISLHLYGVGEAPTSAGGITAGTRLFDLDDGVTRSVNGGAFYCPPTEDVISAAGGLQGDWISTLRDKVELLRRLFRKETAGLTRDQDAAMIQRLATELQSREWWSYALEASGDSLFSSARNSSLYAPDFAAAAAVQLEILGHSAADPVISEEIRRIKPSGRDASFPKRYRDLLRRGVLR